MKKELSVIILSYNTCKITKDCLTALIKTLQKTPTIKTEIIVIDNDSKDNSINMLREFKIKNKFQNIDLHIIFNKKNLGYTKGNNQGIRQANGKYILLLNSDAILKKLNFEELVSYLQKNQKVGALTVRLLFPSGKIDPASHRGFPTIWNSLCYFLKLEKLFDRWPILGKIFGGYHLTYLDFEKEHEIDSPTGAFYLTRKMLLDKLGGFDEKFFMYGEDLDLSMRIKKLGYKIMYLPKYEATHIKYQSGLKNEDRKIKKKVRKHFFESMKIFYKKHYEQGHSTIVNNLVYFFIDIKKKLS